MKTDTATEAVDSAEKSFWIPEERLHGLKDKIDKLAKRAAKLGCGSISYVVGETQYRKRSGAESNKVDAFVAVTVTGTSPRLGGWSFAATIEHLGADGNLIRARPDAKIDLAAYRTAAQVCDHCKTTRRRTETYVVQHEDGRIARVGSNCLRDFLGHKDPQAVASMFQYILDAFGAADAEESYGSGGGASRYFDLGEYLAYVAEMIIRVGYVSSAQARERESDSTAGMALSAMFAKPTKDNPKIYPSDTACDFATRALAYAKQEFAAKADAGEEMSDYGWNISVLVRRDVTDYRSAGLAASIIRAYQKTIEREAERAARNNTFFGTVGKREEFKGLRLVKVRDAESQFGVTHIHRFLTPEGRLAVWFSSGARLQEGRVYDLKATVKKHELRTWKDTSENQTVLTRAKVVAEHDFLKAEDVAAPATK